MIALFLKYYSAPKNVSFGKSLAIKLASKDNLCETFQARLLLYSPGTCVDLFEVLTGTGEYDAVGASVRRAMFDEVGLDECKFAATKEF
jgi:hypothetical protein